MGGSGSCFDCWVDHVADPMAILSISFSDSREVTYLFIDFFWNTKRQPLNGSAAAAAAAAAAAPTTSQQQRQQQQQQRRLGG